MCSDKTAELWLEIDQLHLSYLQHEETPPKLELRKRLERRVKEYLCIVTQDRKFVNIATGDIIVNSAKWIPEFSLVKAAQAFRYIEQYAANLINQPWRQEYRSIRQYNGYYMHNVKSSLSGAEKLFFDMGYTRSISDPEILELDLPSNGDITSKMDSVTKVARDCLLACVECTILQEIHTGLAAQFPVSIDELLDFRRDYVGTPEDAIRELHYRKNQLMYPYPVFNHRMSQMYGPYSVGYAGYAAGSLAPLPGYPLLPGQSALYPSSAAAAAPPPHLISPAINIQPQVTLSGMNGFYPPAAISPQQRAHSQVATLSSVPTGRLLDLEHSPAGSSTSTLRQSHIPTTILELTASEERTKSNDRYGSGARPRDSWADTLAKENGGGDKTRASADGRRMERGKSSAARNTTNGEEFENWEFVFSNLQQRGYNKDQGERPDVLTTTRPSRGNTETPSSNKMYNLTSGEQSEEEELIMKNLSRVQLREQQTERSREEREMVARHRSSREISREITSESEQENSKYSSAQSKNSSHTEKDYRQALMERPQRGNRTKSIHEAQEGWSCQHCTYINTTNNNICEVCFKTRNLPEGDEHAAAVHQLPRISSAAIVSHNGGGVHGARDYLQEKEPVGQECPRCTLVNSPSARICEACDATLSAAPIIPARGKRV